jgi:hypothetical protein
MCLYFFALQFTARTKKIDPTKKHVWKEHKENTHYNSYKMSTQTKSAPIVLDTASWNPNQIRFMPPKVNDKGGKSISLISTQSNRSLHISTPLLTTWGISDFVDPQTGVSDGKYQISFTFPNDSYATKSTEQFLAKMQQFEQSVLEEAVKNSESWWGESLDMGILKHTFFPILKYPKIKGTKKIDTTKKPNLNAKVPFYENENKWNVEIYDTKGELLFPNTNEELTPAHFVPKLSNAAGVLQCGGIWIGGKGWGVTWKLVQAVVKPKIMDTVFGKCHIKLSEEDQVAIESSNVEDDDDSSASASASAIKPVIQTQVADSDEEDEAPKVVAKVEAPKVVAKVEEPKVETPATPAAPATAPATAVKKVVKKVAPKA